MFQVEGKAWLQKDPRLISRACGTPVKAFSNDVNNEDFLHNDVSGWTKAASQVTLVTCYCLLKYTFNGWVCGKMKGALFIYLFILHFSDNQKGHLSFCEPHEGAVVSENADKWIKGCLLPVRIKRFYFLWFRWQRHLLEINKTYKTLETCICLHCIKSGIFLQTLVLVHMLWSCHGDACLSL